MVLLITDRALVDLFGQSCGVSEIVAQKPVFSGSPSEWVQNSDGEYAWLHSYVNVPPVAQFGDGV
jgi:hypothetical protein